MGPWSFEVAMPAMNSEDLAVSQLSEEVADVIVE